jgi:hypothetical protein
VENYQTEDNRNSDKKLQVTFTLQVNLADHGYVKLASAMGLGGSFLYSSQSFH